MSIEDEVKVEGGDHYRKFGRPWNWIGTVIAVGYVMLYLLIIWGCFDSPGFRISSFQFLYLTVGGAAIYTFTYVPATNTAPRNRLAWYDLLLIAAVVPASVCLWLNWYEFKFHMGEFSPWQMFFMIIALGAFLEAARRLVGWILPFIGVLSLGYILASPYLGGIFESPPHDLRAIINALFLGDDGIYGSIMHLCVYTITSVFIFGSFLRALGGDQYFTDIAVAAAGNQWGGGAKVAVVSSGLFGMVSGSGVANVMIDGWLTIPMMQKTGFRKDFSAAVESVASTGGTFMPPVMGAIAFVMADFLNISYWRVCYHAFLPAFCYYFILFLQIHFEALNQGIGPLPLGKTSFWEVMKQGWIVFVPILALIYFLGWRGMTVETSFLYTVLILLGVSSIYKETRPTPRRLAAALEESARVVLTFTPLIIIVGLIVVGINITGLGVRLTHTMSLLGGGDWLLLLVLALVSAFIMGMAISGIASYILLAVFIAPGVMSAATSLNLQPISVHLFLMYVATTSMITPPVCLAVYAACSIAKSNLWRTGWHACRLGLGMFVLPFAFITDQGLLLIGSPLEIGRAVVTALIACILLAAGANGYFFFTRLNAVYRILFLLAGIGLLSPNLQVEMLCLGVAIACILTLRISWKKAGSPLPINRQLAKEIDGEIKMESA